MHRKRRQNKDRVRVSSKLNLTAIKTVNRGAVDTRKREIQGAHHSRQC